jgi:anti-sigma-K factor RskA
VTAPRHIEQDDLALYAMQLLSEEEAAAIAEHLRGCAACREEVAALQGDLTVLAMTSELQSPPASAKQRLFQQIGREKKVVPMPMPPAASAERDASVLSGKRELESVQRGGAADSQRSGIRNVRDIRDGSDLDTAAAAHAALVGARAGRVLPWLAWAVAAGAVLMAGDLYHQREEMRASLVAESVKIAGLSEQAERGQAVLDALTDQSATRVTLTESPEAPKPVGRATYVPDKGTLLFTASNLEPLEQYKTYELWLIPADGHDPIPAGTFLPDARGNASVILPQLPKGVIAKAFGVTIEDAGGSQQPTLPIILVGAPT